MKKSQESFEFIWTTQLEVDILFLETAVTIYV